MRLLLDTHVFLWWDENQLPRAAVQAIQSADVVYASAASAWEIAIKARLGKLETRTPFAAAIADYGFLALPISMR